MSRSSPLFWGSQHPKYQYIVNPEKYNGYTYTNSRPNVLRPPKKWIMGDDRTLKYNANISLPNVEKIKYRLARSIPTAVPPAPQPSIPTRSVNDIIDDVKNARRARHYSTGIVHYPKVQGSYQEATYHNRLVSWYVERDLPIVGVEYLQFNIVTQTWDNGHNGINNKKNIKMETNNGNNIKGNQYHFKNINDIPPEMENDMINRIDTYTRQHGGAMSYICFNTILRNIETKEVKAFHLNGDDGVPITRHSIMRQVHDLVHMYVKYNKDTKWKFDNLTGIKIVLLPHAGVRGHMWFDCEEVLVTKGSKNIINPKNENDKMCFYYVMVFRLFKAEQDEKNGSKDDPYHKHKMRARELPNFETVKKRINNLELNDDYCNFLKTLYSKLSKEEIHSWVVKKFDELEQMMKKYDIAVADFYKIEEMFHIRIICYGYDMMMSMGDTAIPKIERKVDSKSEDLKEVLKTMKKTVKQPTHSHYKKSEWYTVYKSEYENLHAPYVALGLISTDEVNPAKFGKKYMPPVINTIVETKEAPFKDYVPRQEREGLNVDPYIKSHFVLFKSLACMNQLLPNEDNSEEMVGCETCWSTFERTTKNGAKVSAKELLAEHRLTCNENSKWEDVIKRIHKQGYNPTLTFAPQMKKVEIMVEHLDKKEKSRRKKKGESDKPKVIYDRYFTVADFEAIDKNRIQVPTIVSYVIYDRKDKKVVTARVITNPDPKILVESFLKELEDWRQKLFKAVKKYEKVWIINGKAYKTFKWSSNGPIPSEEYKTEELSPTAIQAIVDGRDDSYYMNYQYDWLVENQKINAQLGIVKICDDKYMKKKQRKQLKSNRFDLYEKLPQCHICHKPMVMANADHDHDTGLLRGIICNSCNKKRSYQNILPVLFHNLSGYDGKHIMRYHNYDPKLFMRYAIIAKSRENFMSFSIGKLKFIDSLKHTIASLEALVTNHKKQLVDKTFEEVFPIVNDGMSNCMNDVDKKWFEEFVNLTTKQKIEFCTQKGSFPYNWYKNYSLHEQDHLPSYTYHDGSPLWDLNFQDEDAEGSQCSIEDYKRAQDVWNALKCKKFEDYAAFYCMLDTLQLADVLSSLFDLYYDKFNVDAIQYVSAPGVAYAIMTNKIEEYIKTSRLSMCSELRLPIGTSPFIKEHNKLFTIEMMKNRLCQHYFDKPDSLELIEKLDESNTLYCMYKLAKDLADAGSEDYQRFIIDVDSITSRVIGFIHHPDNYKRYISKSLQEILYEIEKVWVDKDENTLHKIARNAAMMYYKFFQISHFLHTMPQIPQGKEMHQFSVDMIYGGCSGPGFKRYAKKTKNVTINYADETSQYPSAMIKMMPEANFKWLDPSKFDKAKDNLDKATPEDFIQYAYEVEVYVPPEIQDKWIGYPLIIGHFSPDERLSVFNRIHHINNKTKPGPRTGKLVQHFLPKKIIKMGTELAIMKQLGVQITKIHRVMKFHCSHFLTHYINEAFNLRAQNKDNPLGDLCKILINSSYGKFLERVDLRTNKNLVKSYDQLKKQVASSRLKGPPIKINDDFVLIESQKKVCHVDRSFIVGASILAGAKWMMFDFIENCLRKSVGENFTILATDTDSLVFEIKHDEYAQEWTFYEKVLKAGVAKYLDTAKIRTFYTKYIENPSKFLSLTEHFKEYAPNMTGIQYAEKMLSVVSKKNFPCSGLTTFGAEVQAPITQFCSLRAKVYYCETALDDKFVHKGIQKDVMKTFKFDKYISRTKIDAKDFEKLKFKAFRSNQLEIAKLDLEKQYLGSTHDKSYLCSDGITCLPWGYTGTKYNKELEKDRKVAQENGLEWFGPNVY